MKDCVLDVTEHQSDVLSVDGCGKMVVQWLLLLLTALFAEAFHQEVLDICQACMVPQELREVVINRYMFHLLLQQVRLIKEQDDRDIAENPVVDNGLKNVEGLAQPVCLPILHQHLNV